MLSLQFEFHVFSNEIDNRTTVPTVLLRAKPLFVLTAMNESQHMPDQVLLGVFNLVRAGG